MKFSVCCAYSVSLAFALLAANSNAHAASVYTFGGSCVSQGSWTQAALAQTKVLAQVIESLKDNPNCKGIESIISTVGSTQVDLHRRPGEENLGNRLETIPSEINSLRAYLRSNPVEKADIEKLLFSTTLEGTTAAVSAAAAIPAAPVTGPLAIAQGVDSLILRANRAAQSGLDFANGVFDILPKYDRCLIGNPSQGAAILAATIKMAASFAASEQGTMSRMGNSVAKLLTMLAQRKFTKVLRQLDQTEFWLSMSCLLETTSQNYCSAKDAYEILLYNSKNEAMVQQNASDTTNPLEGYYLLTREVPTVAEWVQKVQFGTKPRISTDATFKNLTWGAQNSFQQSENALIASYGEGLLTLAAAPDAQAKKNTVFKMVSRLVELITRGGLSDDKSDSSIQNFFTQSMPAELIPFYLVGMDEIPPECAPPRPGESKFPVSWDTWMKGTGGFVSMFSDPDLLAARLGTRLESLIGKARDGATLIFRQRLIVDLNNLVNEAMTHQSLTVVESLEHIASYLDRLQRRVIKERALSFVPAIHDTRMRVGTILQAFQLLNEAATAMTAVLDQPAGKAAVSINQLPQVMSLLDKFAEFSPKSRPKIEDISRLTKPDQVVVALGQLAVQNVVDTSFSEFNVLLQRDTFLATRLSTLVREDYALRIRSRDSMSQYQQDLLYVSGKSLLDRLTEVQRMNPEEVRVDLTSAQFVNKQNLVAFETLFAREFLAVIHRLNQVIHGDNAAKEAFWAELSKEGRSAARTAGSLMAPIGSSYLLESWLPLMEPSAFSDALYKFTGKFVPVPNRALSDDKYGTFEQLKAKLCIQTLAFQNREMFAGECQDAAMRSIFVNSGKSTSRFGGRSLNTYYRDFLKKDETGYFDENGVCAFRDHMRKNMVYWLTKNLSEANRANGTPSQPKP